MVFSMVRYIMVFQLSPAITVNTLPRTVSMTARRKESRSNEDGWNRVVANPGVAFFLYNLPTASHENSGSPPRVDPSLSSRPQTRAVKETKINRFCREGGALWLSDSVQYSTMAADSDAKTPLPKANRTHPGR